MIPPTSSLMALLLVACGRPDLPTVTVPSGATASAIRAGGGGSSTWVSVDVLATDDDGDPVPCTGSDVDFSVRVSFDGGVRWVTLRPDSVEVRCGSEVPPDVAIVVDNSGSQESVVQPTQEGTSNLIDGVLDAGGRASVVRVSTFSRVVEPLVADGAALDEAVGQLESHGGWTALYDGLRMGNETLGRELSDPYRSGWPTLSAFCDDWSPRAMVTFTNGEDNNSAEERLSGFDDDGFDTTFDDVMNLTIDGVLTPVHTIGLGPRVDESRLATLSAWTGGRAVSASGSDAIPDAFSVVGSWLDASAHVCAEVPVRGCGPAEIDASWTWHAPDGTTTTGSRRATINVACPATEATGAVTSILLTLTSPDVPRDLATDLAEDAVRWVSPVDQPRVLVVRDDNHHGEDAGDSALITDLLNARGLNATYLEEPADGLTEDHLAAYDVVWFSNPGWPMDDFGSFEAMRRFAAVGRGVVLQGDDMAWSMGAGFSLSPLTHLAFLDNGTSTCGRTTDDRSGATLRTTLVGDHPVVARRSGSSFEYGNDIDVTAPMEEGEQVLAWAELADDACDAPRPVVVAWEP